MRWWLLRWCGIAALVIGPVARAEADSPPPLPEESLTELRQRAMKAFDAGRPEETFRLLRAAWELRKNYFDICSLAHFQMNSKRWRDAAESYAICKRALPEVMSSSTKLVVEREMQKVRSHVGTITVTANVPGAEVRLDGEIVGKTPLEQPIFVNPGWYAVDVRAPGYASVGKVFEMKAGRSDVWDVHLELKASAAPTGQEPASPAPKPTQEPPFSAPKASLSPVLPSPPSGSPASRGLAQEEGRGPATPLLIAGIGLGFVGIGVASASFVAASNATTDADGLYEALPGTGQEFSCTKVTSPLCEKIFGLRSRASVFTGVGIGALVVGATGGAMIGGVLIAHELQRLNWKAGAQGTIVVAPGVGALSIRGTF